MFRLEQCLMRMGTLIRQQCKILVPAVRMSSYSPELVSYLALLCQWHGLQQDDLLTMIGPKDVVDAIQDLLDRWWVKLSWTAISYKKSQKCITYVFDSCALITFLCLILRARADQQLEKKVERQRSKNKRRRDNVKERKRNEKKEKKEKKVKLSCAAAGDQQEIKSDQ